MTGTSRSRLTAVIAGCALLAAAGGAGVSLAYFSNSAQSQGNSAGTGTIVLTDVTQGSSVFPTTDAIRPGGPDVVTTQVVGNGGDVGGGLKISTSNISNTNGSLSTVLKLQIDECPVLADTTCASPTNRYNGPLTGAESTAISLAVGQQKRVRLRLYWLMADNSVALHNASTTFKLDWVLKAS